MDSSGENDFPLAMHMTAMHIQQIQATREPTMSLNRLYNLIGNHLKTLVPETQQFAAMCAYCERHGLDTPWDNDLKGITPEQAIGKTISAVFRINADDPEHTETVTGKIVAVHEFRGVLASFPAGLILVNQIDLIEFL